MVEAYQALHEAGFAHSVEAWDEYGELVGGLYGVSIDGVFAGESMFHRVPNASKLVVFHGRIRGNTLEGFPCARKHIMSFCLPSSV